MDKKLKSSLIPQVSEIRTNGLDFSLREGCIISVSHREIEGKGSLLRSCLKRSTGFDLPMAFGFDGDIRLVLEGDPGAESKDVPDESYSIEVLETHCEIRAAGAGGMVRAIMTFLQLFPKEIFSEEKVPGFEWIIEGCKIADSPRFRWRGIHLDVARHFVAKEDVCRLIDRIALYKYNRLHLHLTDDQGWRIEIKKYPLLTEIGAFRDATLIGHLGSKPKKYDDVPYSGYFTQQDIREIVEYAAVREISIVPEIDMPGHMQAAIAAYPHLGCTDMTLKPLCHWGICQNILNGEDSTVQFMKDVLDEIMDLFPGEYIHVGGDEVPKYQWEEQRRVQDRMAELGLKDEDELQSWFIGQMASHIQSRGRKVIGWDEILDGGIAENAAVMSWRGEEGGLKAASLGHNVVMTPYLYTYFDQYQRDQKDEPLAIGGDLSLGKVYSFEPIPKGLGNGEERYILGAQGQIWTEYVKEYSHLEYMVFPRACALAEVLWTESAQRDFSSFRSRLKKHEALLKTLKVNYCQKWDGQNR